MLQTRAWLVIGASLLAVTGRTASADELALLDTPVKVTATFNALDEGGFAAQIGVHNGPIAQLVHTVLRVDTASNAQRLLRKQVQWRAPYLFVHSSCGGGRSLQCEGEAVFKLVDGTATRLGDVIGTAPAVYAQGDFVDVYDKLEGRLGLTLEPIPSFLIVLDDVNGKLAVNSAATWAGNAATWRIQADQPAGTQPGAGNTTEAPYLAALISNAALARYCNRTDELQELLNNAKTTLNSDQLRMVTDAISKVVPLELPRAWRKPY
jgi:hypothetical protein